MLGFECCKWPEPQTEEAFPSHSLAAVCVAATIPLSAQTFTTLAIFNVTDGAQPEATLAQGLDGNFYGTTSEGGRQLCSGGCGTVFKITPEGTLMTLHKFVKTDGYYSQAGLVLATDGNFYRATTNMLFEISSGGRLTTLNSGVANAWTLVQDKITGNFYGITGCRSATMGVRFSV